AADAAAVEFGKRAPLCAVVEHHPGDQGADHNDGCGISHDDEANVICCVHRQLAVLACISRSVRTRRRRISLRIAASCSVTNSSVNATVMTRSGMRMLGSMVGPPRRNTEAL